MSLCLGEFGLTYEQYANMTWAEFKIRLFAFNRIEKRDWQKIHEINKYTILSSFMDGKDKKKLLNTLDGALNKKPKGVTDAQKNAILNAQKQYNNRK